VITLERMYFHDEIRPADELKPRKVSVGKQELEMARQLIESLTAEFDPSKFHDEYREAVGQLIERKKTTGDARPAPVAAAPADDAGDSMTDLLTALQRSVEAAKAANGKAAEEEAPPKKASARRSTKKADEEKPAARKRTRKPA
jgi:DNA end-binding protein Ku